MRSIQPMDDVSWLLVPNDKVAVLSPQNQRIPQQPSLPVPVPEAETCTRNGWSLIRENLVGFINGRQLPSEVIPSEPCSWRLYLAKDINNMPCQTVL